MINETKKLKTTDGEELHLNIHENGSKYWLIVTHGMGEHCGRHQYMYKLFSQYFNICLYDLRGHGKSSGKRAYIDSFKDYVRDLGDILEFLRDTYSMDEYVLFGHSMGGLITASFMQNEVSDNLYPVKVFLSAPAVAGAGGLGQLFKVAPLKIMDGLTKIPMSVPVGGLLDLSRLSHDPRVYENYVTDSMNTMKVHTKTFFELLNESRNVFNRPLRVKCPLYCAVGTGDGLVDPGSVISYFKEIEKNCNLYICEGGYHEMHNEIEKFRAPYLEFLRESIMDSLFLDS